MGAALGASGMADAVGGPAVTSLRAAIDLASDRLAVAGVTSPRPDAVALAAHLLGLTPGATLAAAARGERAPEGLEALVDERVRRVPLQHLTGRTGFRRLTLAVGPGVFVPRPETELVAGAAIEIASAVHAARPAGAPVVVDLCAGSGAIAAAVADEVPGAVVHAVELDPAAHAWAGRNLAGSAVTLHLADATDPAAPPGHLDGTVDVVVANPPYVPEGMEPLDPEVAEHDPPLALYGRGPDGLSVPRALCCRVSRLLRPGGALVLEHGAEQQDQLVRWLLAQGWAQVEGHRDLAGRPRYVIARAPDPSPPA